MYVCARNVAWMGKSEGKNAAAIKRADGDEHSRVCCCFDHGNTKAQSLLLP